MSWDYLYEGFINEVKGCLNPDALNYTEYGLPILELTGDVTSMTKENAVNLAYKYGGRTGVASVKWQGASSLYYPKKNYTIKFDNAFEAAEGWGEQKKYCLKANFIDHSHARNIVSAKLWGQMVKSRKFYGDHLDISKITGLVNNKGDNLSHLISISDDGVLTNNASTYSNGSLMFTGAIFEPGEYVISFEHYNPNTSETDIRGAIDIVFVSPDGANVSNKIVKAFTERQQWVSFTAAFTVTQGGARLSLQHSGSVELTEQSGYQFRNLKVVRANGSSADLSVLAELPNGGAIDGFPCIIKLNGEFHGLYTFNIPKDGWMFGMGDGTKECIMCANNHSAATRFETMAICDESDFEIEYITDETDTQWAIDSLNRLISAVLESNGSDIDTTVAKYVDIESAIDFYLSTVLQSGGDNTDKNYLLVTFDGVKWFFSPYDMDSTFGLQWTGKGFNDPEKAWPTFYGFNNKLLQLLLHNKQGDIKNRYIELRNSVLSDGAVINTFENFMAGIPSSIRDQDAKKWPLIPSTTINNLSQISTNYILRAKKTDAEIYAMIVPTITNYLLTSIDPQTGEIFGGVGYQDNYVAAEPAYGYYVESSDVSGYVTTGLVEFPVYSVVSEGQLYESPVMYVKGNVTFDKSAFNRILAYVADRTSAISCALGGSMYFNVEELGKGYYKITYLASDVGNKAKIVDWMGIQPKYVQLSMLGVGNGLIISIGEPIE